MDDFFNLFIDDSAPKISPAKKAAMSKPCAEYVQNVPAEGNGVVIFCEAGTSNPFNTSNGSAFRSGLATGGIDFAKCTRYEITSTDEKSILRIAEALYTQLKQFNTIITVGQTLTKSFVNLSFHDEAGVSMERFRGICIPDQKLGAWLCPISDLTYAYFGPAQRAYATVLQLDAINIGKCTVGKTVPTVEGNVHILSPQEGAKYLREVAVDEPDWFTFDYETTGLKPHKRGHRIVSMSYATNSTDAYSFLYDSSLHRAPLRAILTNPRIKKCAANLQMEETWSRYHIGAGAANWGWDVNVAAHCADNRSSGAGLKYNAYVQLGVSDWAASSKPYLKDSSGCGNGFNRINECPQDELLLYGGYDSLYEEKLREIQMKGFGYE